MNNREPKYIGWNDMDAFADSVDYNPQNYQSQQMPQHSNAFYMHPYDVVYKNGRPPMSVSRKLVWWWAGLKFGPGIIYVFFAVMALIFSGTEWFFSSGDITSNAGFSFIGAIVGWALSMARLASHIVIIVAKIKYPRDKVVNICFWIDIGLIILAILALVGCFVALFMLAPGGADAIDEFLENMPELAKSLEAIIPIFN